MADIARFRKENGCDRLVMVWCGSTEAYHTPPPVHQSLAAFEKGLRESDPEIAPSQVYAYAALRSGVPFANGAPNLTVDLPAAGTGRRDRHAHLRQGLQDRPDADQDHPRPGVQGPHARGERLVLHQHPGQPRRRGARRPGVLQDQGGLQAGRAGAHPPARASTPSSTATIYHKVRINYYPPRGDNKEGWDNIDIFGWLGYPMQIKVDFLCRDSSSPPPSSSTWPSSWTWPSAPGMSGIQEWLSFYFKSPRPRRGCTPSTTCSSSSPS